MNDYERVARVIEHLDAHFRDQPDLDALATLVGLSPFHFHRLFRRWAGTTPKVFLQHLTSVAAGRLLRGGRSTLDTALDVGLSGPGRLHDLCVKVEAASPGEIRSGGEGWSIEGGFSDTPFGRALIARTPRGICRLAFIADAAAGDTEWAALGRLWPRATLKRNDRAARRMASEIFVTAGGSGTSTGLPLHVVGTPFQHRVWRALVQIPCGEARSYGQIAQAIHAPESVRAVGSAAGRNPVAFAIPCHRVIHSTGLMGHYHWGPVRKRVMLAWERGGG